MRIVRGDDRKACLVGQREDLGVELGLTLGVVGLNLEVVTIREEVGVPVRGLLGTLPVVRREVPGHLSRHARGADDEAAGVRGQGLPVYAGPMAEAFCVPYGGELDQVLVALHVPGEQHQMVVGPLTLAGLRAVPAISRGHVRLHPDDGLEPFFARQFVERPSAEHAPVVREGHAGHLEFFGFVDEIGEAVGSVEEGVLGVCMEVDEAHNARFRRSG